jgi:predicted porin
MIPPGRFLTVVLILLLCPWHAWADEFRIVPFIGAKEEYNGNILMVTEAQGVNKDFISILSPGIDLVDRSDRFDTDLSAQLDRLDYSHYRELSATNQAYNGSFLYRATPLLNIAAGAGYSINSNPSLDYGSASAIQAGTVIPMASSNPTSPGQTSTGQANQGISVASAPVPVVSLPMKRFIASLSSDYQFSERTSVVASYNFYNDIYEEPTYRDMAQSVSAGLVYDLGKYLSSLKGRIDVGYSAYYVPDSRTYSATCTVGISRDFDEVWSASVDAGVSRTWTEFLGIGYVQNTPTTLMAVQEQQYNSDWGQVAKVSLNYRGEQLQGNLAYIKNISLAPGLDGAAEQNSYSLTSRYRLTYEFSALVTTSYNTYKSDLLNYSAQVINQQTFDANAGIQYQFSKDTALDISYEYTLIRYPAADANAYRQLVFIGVRTQFPLFE